jgi:hypothetical protein
VWWQRLWWTASYVGCRIRDFIVWWLVSGECKMWRRHGGSADEAWKVQHQRGTRVCTLPAETCTESVTPLDHLDICVLIGYFKSKIICKNINKNVQQCLNWTEIFMHTVLILKATVYWSLTSYILANC